MFGPWFTVTLLALESTEVIGLRVAKFAGGGVDAQHEAHLMVSEKIDAVVEVSARFLCGATADNVINRFRQQVAANAERLAVEREAAPKPVGTQDFANDRLALAGPNRRRRS